MKLQAILIASCLPIAITATSVAEKWLNSKGGRYYDAYCGTRPRFADTKHLCVTASADIVKSIQETSTFRGYLSRKGDAFALVPNHEMTVIRTKKYHMIVDFKPSRVPAEHQGKCAEVIFTGTEVDPKITQPHYYCQPGAQPVKMPA
ncbi:uncharacterized protein UTRI_10010 [Ustilago trichophora]|uniref:Uncharacterized protein n=1 Tax=Ustilago trichophora TaxID=86804 RepID=A0A5C3DP92_9BASI|nr:uncharacterized protein UTRI_10010 [Ustilago trichophora]